MSFLYDALKLEFHHFRFEDIKNGKIEVTQAVLGFEFWKTTYNEGTKNFI
jgi:hypothetical protein